MLEEASQLLEIIQSNPRILLVTHKLADVDAIASAIALARIIKNLNKDKNIGIFVPNGPLKPARELLENYSYNAKLI